MIAPPPPLYYCQDCARECIHDEGGTRRLSSDGLSPVVLAGSTAPCECLISGMITIIARTRVPTRSRVGLHAWMIYVYVYESHVRGGERWRKGETKRIREGRKRDQKGSKEGRKIKRERGFRLSLVPSDSPQRSRTLPRRTELLCNGTRP